ncbi:MAG: 2-succinyl-5-enolpyruvyl-6-hydroxy-3-cyclohexene-1-carboxylic-acid synthase [Chlamydiae bacterium CG10_big_fil_rev_8_21_14_0_10_42_34]|nr:MAG: 2-succinyl-5-enolpyruvyl-6-hydroxy-3-cyclohexene-1-carboxylic-acid synthase [Chlamydiae bacterium CG10_big_fil_rev_8_21_14_0_10_42_34]
MKAFWIIDQLVQQGATQFCIAPGSRSTPLVLAVKAHPKATLHLHFDERGLGFFALGLATSTKKPAVIIVTSGTAVGNLVPSVMEAHHTCTPLILLTADRPQSLRDCGANQTTDQNNLFQNFVRWQIDIGGELDAATIRSISAQGYFYACQNPPGPIQINCPFSEPLYMPHRPIIEGKPIEIQLPRLKAAPYKTEHSKGLIFIGRLPSADDVVSVLELAERLEWPVCADITSNARCYETVEQIHYFDWIDKPRPEIILHFGERLTSKKIIEWASEMATEYVHISPWPQLQDPARIITARVQSDIVEFCETFEGKVDPYWLDEWNDQLPHFEETGVFTEVHLMRHIGKILPPDWAVFLGNGMPIRDADHFLFPEECAGFFANRGLSGIDGNIATIAGIAQSMPVVAIIGDQAALHDLNSLPLLKNTAHPVILIISNNFGGGIFHHLPVSQSPDFETLWAASHHLRFENAAKMFDLPFRDFTDLEKIFSQKQSTIIEVITDRKENFSYQQSAIRLTT